MITIMIITIIIIIIKIITRHHSGQGLNPEFLRPFLLLHKVVLKKITRITNFKLNVNVSSLELLIP